MKHQLNIHLDYGLSTAELGALEVRYGYPHSGEHSLREQVLRIPSAALDPELRADLESLLSALVARIPAPDPVRLPHASVTPEIRPTGMTFVVLDQARAQKMPIARLLYQEVVKPLSSQVERKVYLERGDWTPAERSLCERIQASVKKLAWQDYERLMGFHLFGQETEGA